jgi:hypothetical protein
MSLEILNSDGKLYRGLPVNILSAAMGALDIVAGVLLYFYAPSWFFISVLLILKGGISFL